MTLAEKIAGGKVKVPSDVQAALDKVVVSSQECLDGIDEALRSDFYAVEHYYRGNGNLSPDEARAAAEKTAAAMREHATYAYSFYECKDGSALVAFVARHGEEPRLRAFPSMVEAGRFHPTRAAAGEG